MFFSNEFFFLMIEANCGISSFQVQSACYMVLKSSVFMCIEVGRWRFSFVKFNLSACYFHEFLLSGGPRLFWLTACVLT